MLEASFSLCDQLNPGFGYQLKIEEGGRVVFHSSKDPITGRDLLCARDCVEVIKYYLAAEFASVQNASAWSSPTKFVHPQGVAIMPKNAGYGNVRSPFSVDGGGYLPPLRTNENKICLAPGRLETADGTDVDYGDDEFGPSTRSWRDPRESSDYGR